MVARSRTAMMHGFRSRLPELDKLLGRNFGEIDTEAINAWLTASGLNLSFLAAWDRLYQTRGVRLAYRKDAASGSLAVSIDSDERACVDDDLVRYLVAKLNNAVLILGGRHARVLASQAVVRSLERTLQTDERIVECYGDRFRWDVRPVVNGGVGSYPPQGLSVDAANTGFETRIGRPRKPSLVHTGDALFIGMDVGGSRTKVVVMEGGKVLDTEIHRFLISQQDSLSRLENELGGIVQHVLTRWNSHRRASGVGLSWAGPVSYGRILSPVKLTHCRDVNKRFQHFSQLARVITERIGVPVSLINDGKAAALAVAADTARTDLLCLGLGTTVAAGFVDGRGCVDSDICELTAATMNMDSQKDPRVSRHASVKFGLPHIAGVLGYRSDACDFSELSDEIFKSFQEGDSLAESIVGVLGVYLGEAIAMSFDFLRMKNLALVGGVAQNAELVHATMAWLRERYPELRVEHVRTSSNLEYLSARGAVVYAMLEHVQKEHRK